MRRILRGRIETQVSTESLYQVAKEFAVSSIESVVNRKSKEQEGRPT